MLWQSAKFLSGGSRPTCRRFAVCMRDYVRVSKSPESPHHSLHGSCIVVLRAWDGCRDQVVDTISTGI